MPGSRLLEECLGTKHLHILFNSKFAGSQGEVPVNLMPSLLVRLTLTGQAADLDRLAGESNRDLVAWDTCLSSRAVTVLISIIPHLLIEMSFLPPFSSSNWALFTFSSCFSLVSMSWLGRLPPTPTYLAISRSSELSSAILITLDSLIPLGKISGISLGLMYSNCENKWRSQSYCRMTSREDYGSILCY